MSQTKAQLIQPIGVVTASGVVVSGVMTAATFDGDIVGSATSIIQGTNLNLGAFNATSFAGDFTGNATGIITSSAIKVGQLTASSFVGDFTGTATSMMRGTGFEAGAVTGTSFVANVTGNVTGNATGLAGSVTQGTNIHVGVVTATSLYGDGSNLTGIAATNFNTQTVAAVGAATTIDLSAGNMIKFNQNANTTVSFASTSEAMNLTLIRSGGEHSVAISYATGAVTIAANDDYISIPASSDYDIGTGDFTFECWMYADSLVTSSHSKRLFDMGSANADGLAIRIDAAGNVQVALDNSSVVYSGDGGVSTGEWNHVALCRESSTMTLYINGKIPSGTATATVGNDIDKQTDTFFIGANHDSPSTSSWNGEISNFRYVKGTAVYTEAFLPPTEALTNITNTKLLCCQSTSSATAAAVTPGTLTVNGTVTAAAATVSLAAASYATKGTITWPSNLTWNAGTAPTLITSPKATAAQQFQFLTRDSGVTWYGWETYNNARENWSLFSWGINQAGELGQNQVGPWNGTPAWAHTRSSPTQVGADTTWSVLESTSGDNNTSLALKSDGTLWTWASSANGKLGQNQGPGTDRSSPTQVGTDTTWSYAQGNRTGLFGTKTDGTLWSWGYNGNGSLGQGNTTEYSSPTQIGTGTDWGTETYQLGGNWTVGAAVKTDGTLWTWGAQSAGELGHNQQNQNYSSPKQVGTDTTWRSVGGAYAVTLATKTNGTLWVWGSGAKGGTAQNNETYYSSPTQIPGTTWSEVTAYGGWQTWGMLKTDGTLWSWGDNANGSAGQNSVNNGYSSPVQLPGTTWKQNDRGDNGCVGAVKTDGTLWTWGIANYGVLGQNANVTLSSPTQVGSGNTWESVSVNTTCMLGLRS